MEFFSAKSSLNPEVVDIVIVHKNFNLRVRISRLSEEEQPKVGNSNLSNSENLNVEGKKQ